MKKLLLIAAAALVSLTLAACVASVKSESQLVKYAEKNFGETELLKTEKPDEDHIICYFRDKKYGFEYTVKSSVSDILIDGSKFGESESTNDNYVSVLLKYIKDTEKDRLSEIEKSHGCTIETDKTYTDSIADIMGDDESSVSAAAVELAEVFSRYNDNGALSGISIGGVDRDKNLLGTCDIKGKWKDKKQLEEDHFIMVAHQIDSKAEFLGREEKTFGETGLSLEDVDNPMWESDRITGNDDKVTYYYFSLDGKKFFIADFYVKKERDKVGTYYSDYKTALGIKD